VKRFFYIKLLLVLLILLCNGNVAIADDDEYTVDVDEDAYVRESNPTQNYGNSNQLGVGWLQASQGLDRTWLKFNLTDLSLPSGTTVASAQLHIYRYNHAGTTLSEGVYYGSDDSWTETGITWSNQPSFSSTATDTFTPSGDGSYPLDVTLPAKTAYEGDKTLTLVLRLEDESVPDTGQNYWTAFASKQNTSYDSPYLTVTATPEPASIFLFGAGLVGLAWYVKRRKNR